MAAHTQKIRLLHDTIVAPASEPRGVATYGKVGDIVELDRWTALHLCQCHEEFPRAELVKAKSKE